MAMSGNLPCRIERLLDLTQGCMKLAAQYRALVVSIGPDSAIQNFCQSLLTHADVLEQAGTAVADQFSLRRPLKVPTEAYIAGSGVVPPPPDRADDYGPPQPGPPPPPPREPPPAAADRGQSHGDSACAAAVDETRPDPSAAPWVSHGGLPSSSAHGPTRPASSSRMAESWSDDTGYNYRVGEQIVVCRQCRQVIGPIDNMVAQLAIQERRCALCGEINSIHLAKYVI